MSGVRRCVRGERICEKVGDVRGGGVISTGPMIGLHKHTPPTLCCIVY